MIEVVSADQFQTIRWKNGQGVTTELAINPGATLADFDWRLSIASVVKMVHFLTSKVITAN